MQFCCRRANCLLILAFAVVTNGALAQSAIEIHNQLVASVSSDASEEAHYLPASATGPLTVPGYRPVRHYGEFWPEGETPLDWQTGTDEYFSFDNGGRIMSASAKAWRNDAWVESTRSLIESRGDTLITNVQQWNESWLPIRRIIEVIKDRRLVKRQVFINSGSEYDEVILTETWSYGDAGEILTETVNDHQSNTFTTRSFSEFDDQGNWRVMDEEEQVDENTVETRCEWVARGAELSRYLCQSPTSSGDWIPRSAVEYLKSDSGDTTIVAVNNLDIFNGAETWTGGEVYAWIPGGQLVRHETRQSFGSGNADRITESTYSYDEAGNRTEILTRDTYRADNGYMDHRRVYFTYEAGNVAPFDQLVNTSRDDQGADPGLELDWVSYPNPVRQEMAIRFELERSGDVTIDLIDAIGRTITEIKRTALPAGLHETVWKRQGEPAGTYILRLRTGDKMTSRMITIA